MDESPPSPPRLRLEGFFVFVLSGSGDPNMVIVSGKDSHDVYDTSENVSS